MHAPLLGDIVVGGELTSDPALVLIIASFACSVLAIFFRPRSSIGGIFKILFLLAGLLASVIALLIPQVLFRGYEGFFRPSIGHLHFPADFLLSSLSFGSLNIANTKDVLEIVLTLVTIILNLTQINLTLVQINQASRER